MSDAHIFKHYEHFFCQLFLTYFFFCFFCSFKFQNQLQITSAANTLFFTFFPDFCHAKAFFLLLIWLNLSTFFLVDSEFLSQVESFNHSKVVNKVIFNLELVWFYVLGSLVHLSLARFIVHGINLIDHFINGCHFFIDQKIHLFTRNLRCHLYHILNFLCTFIYFSTLFCSVSLFILQNNTFLNI